MLKYIVNNFKLISKLSKETNEYLIKDIDQSDFKFKKAPEKEDLEIIKLLINKITDKSVINKCLSSVNKEKIFEKAIESDYNLEIIELLFENGTSKNNMFTNACFYGNVEAIKILLKYNVTIHSKECQKVQENRPRSNCCDFCEIMCLMSSFGIKGDFSKIDEKDLARLNNYRESGKIILLLMEYMLNHVFS